MKKTIKHLLLVVLLSAAAMPAKAEVVKYIQSKSTLQSGTTIYVSSGTVGYLNVTSSFSAKGSATNDSALTGQIGEYISSFHNTANVPVTGQYVVYSTITLTAGDWDVWGRISWQRNSATFTTFDLECSITSTPGNSFTGSDVTNSCGMNLGNANLSFGFFDAESGPFRVSISATTDYYMKAYTAVYSAGTPQVSSYIAARRRR